MILEAIEIRLKPKERALLEARLRAATTEQRQLLRIRIVIEAADGHATREIARELETTPGTSNGNVVSVNVLARPHGWNAALGWRVD